MPNENKSRKWQRIIEHELFEYFANFVFLAFFLVAFAWYRRLVLEEYHIHYFGYWGPVIEAAILAKVIMIGDALHMGRALENKPLIVSTIYRTIVFSLLVVLFAFAERILGAVIHGKTVADGIAEIISKGRYEILAWSVLIIVAFLPFFAVKEIERIFGEEKVRGIFFRGQPENIESGRININGPAKQSPSS